MGRRSWKILSSVMIYFKNLEAKQASKTVKQTVEWDSVRDALNVPKDKNILLLGATGISAEF